MPAFNELTHKAREVLAQLLEDGDNDLRAKIALGLLRLDQRPQDAALADVELPDIEDEAEERFKGQFR